MLLKPSPPRETRRAARRRKRNALLSATLALATAFAAGFLWKSHTMRASQKHAPLTPAAAGSRRAALAAIDESLRAKSEKRTTGRLAALDRARRSDPAVPALDILFAETALEARKFDDMRTAAARARAKGDHAAGAELLQGLDKWINRGAGDREVSASADNAAIHFTAATDADFFFAPAWFFWSDVLRYAGSEAEGRARILSALRRFNPWDSSSVITAKAAFASAEAGTAALTLLPDSPWARATADLAARRQAGETPSPDSLTPFGAQSALRALATDRIFTAAQDGKNQPHGSPAGQP